jgi:hypothetical protein
LIHLREPDGQWGLSTTVLAEIRGRDTFTWCCSAYTIILSHQLYSNAPSIVHQLLNATLDVVHLLIFIKNILMEFIDIVVELRPYIFDDVLFEIVKFVVELFLGFLFLSYIGFQSR